MRDFADSCRHWHHVKFLLKCISHFELSGTNCNADGIFGGDGHDGMQYKGGDRTATWGRQRVKFAVQYIERKGVDVWAIVRYTPPADEDEDEKYEICWYAPYSENWSVPPVIGWVPGDALARGYPRLKYILHETIG